MIKIEGLDKVLNRLDTLVDTSRLESLLGTACALVERSAKEKAPKGTGELRRSITSKVENQQGIIYTPLEYAPYVEYGTGLFAEKGGRVDVPWAYEDEKTGELIWTSGQRPQPYMRPALNENREEILRIIQEGIVNND